MIMSMHLFSGVKHNGGKKGNSCKTQAPIYKSKIWQNKLKGASLFSESIAKIYTSHENCKTSPVSAQMPTSLKESHVISSENLINCFFTSE